MSNEKKKWSKPQLIVLGRGTPEENVLAGCKGVGGGDVNVTNVFTCLLTGCVTFCTSPSST